MREALRMTSEGFGQHLCTSLSLRGGEPVVHIVRREQPEPDVMVLGVVPGEEVAAEAAHVLERAEALRKVGPVLHGFELRLRERVVVGDVGTRVGLGDAEIGEQQRYWLR